MKGEGIDSVPFGMNFDVSATPLDFPLHGNRTKDSDKFSKKLLHAAGKIDVVCIL